MTSKELKNKLKAAREAIRVKEYKEALKLCKMVLSEDKNNYNAMVFVGVASEGLDQYEQALKAYHMASEISPEQLLAWQGLSTIYCKVPDQMSSEEMINVYEKLITLSHSDKVRQHDFARKLVSLLGVSNITKSLSLLDRIEADCYITGELDIVAEKVHLLTQADELSPELETKLMESLENLLCNSQMPEELQESYSEKYLLFLEKREPTGLYAKCSKLVAHLPSLYGPIATLLRLLLDRQIVRKQLEDLNEIRRLSDLLFAHHESKDGPAYPLAQGYIALENDQYEEAKVFFQDGVGKADTWLCGHIYLSTTLEHLHATSDCLQVCQQALAVSNMEDCIVTVNCVIVRQTLYLRAARCCLHQRSQGLLEQGLEFLHQAEPGQDVAILYAYTYLNLGDIGSLNVVLDQLTDDDSTPVKALRAWIDFHHNNCVSAISILQDCVSEDPGNSEYQLKLGRALWQVRENHMESCGRCYAALVKAAELDRYCSDTFLYLGHFYNEVEKNRQLAKECYQRAYNLDSGNGDAGAALCEVLDVCGEESALLIFLEDVTKNAGHGCALWAWLRLGLLHRKSGNILAAINCFYSISDTDQTNFHVWESLAEVYLYCGTYASAEKAFTKALELKGDSIYSRYQIATIKRIRGQLPDAAEEYKHILKTSADYVPALKGLGETYLQMCKNYLSRCLVGLATDICEKAIAYLFQSIMQKRDLCCVWKLLGDCCACLSGLHSSTQISVPKFLYKPTNDWNTDTVCVSKAQVIGLGTRCYGHAVSLSSGTSSLWHDLGVSLFLLCHEQSDETEQKKCAERSIQVLKKALHLNPSSHLHWLALGTVSASKYIRNFALAQHCFIKSIISMTNNTVAWTNLGALYLQQNNIELAREAFMVARNQDPEYVNCVIGQALVAEIGGNPESKNLFRHSTELGLHMESCIGYGHWVISCLSDVKNLGSLHRIQQMEAVQAAIFALTYYTEVKKDDVCACNMLGLLQEHQQLNLSALATFCRAERLAVCQNLSEETLRKVRLNYARLLRKTGQYVEACTVYTSCVEGHSFHDLCQWGLSLYTADQLSDSLNVYRQALDYTANNLVRSEVLAALGMLFFQSNCLDMAKNAFFEGFNSGSPSQHGLFALCALALIEKDLNLAESTLQELCSMITVERGFVDFALLKSAVLIMKGHIDDAVSDVERLVNVHPGLIGIRSLKCRLLWLRGSDVQPVVPHTKMAFVSDPIRHQDAMVYPLLSQLYLGRHSRKSSAEDPLQTAQRAFHLMPYNRSAMCCLATALHAEGVLRLVSHGNKSMLLLATNFFTVVSHQDSISSALACWCLKQIAVLQILTGGVSSELDVLQQLHDRYSEDRLFVDIMRSVINSDLTVPELLNNQSNAEFYYHQVLLNQLIQHRRWSDVMSLLCKLLDAGKNKDQTTKIVCLMLKAWVLCLQVQHGDAGVQSITVEFEDACHAVEEHESSRQPSSLLQVLQGLVYMEHRPKKAMYHFHKALSEGYSDSCFGEEVEVAKCGLIQLLHKSGKNQDKIQQLLKEADHKTLLFYHSLDLCKDQAAVDWSSPAAQYTETADVSRLL